MAFNFPISPHPSTNSRLFFGYMRPRYSLDAPDPPQGWNAIYEKTLGNPSPVSSPFGGIWGNMQGYIAPGY
jgi:hypothetical protein